MQNPNSILASKNLRKWYHFWRHRLHVKLHETQLPWCYDTHTHTFRYALCNPNLLTKSVYVINANSRCEMKFVFLFISFEARPESCWHPWNCHPTDAFSFCLQVSSFISLFRPTNFEWKTSKRNAFGRTFATHAWPPMNRNQNEMAMDNAIKGRWNISNKRIALRWMGISSRHRYFLECYCLWHELLLFVTIINTNSLTHREIFKVPCFCQNSMSNSSPKFSNHINFMQNKDDENQPIYTIKTYRSMESFWCV